MKSQYVLFLLMIFGTITSNGQFLSAFQGDSACYPYFAGDNRNYIYKIGAQDTMIGGMSFQPFYEAYLTSGMNFFNIRGYISEDTAAGKTYFVQPGQTVSQVIQDLNLQVGQWWHSPFKPAGDSLLVDSVKFIDGRKHIIFFQKFKHRTTGQSIPITFVEGAITNTLVYFIEPFNYSTHFGNEPQCFIRYFANGDSTVYYYRSGLSCYPNKTYVGRQEELEEQLKVYPNPSAGNLNLELTGNGPSELNIYTLSGQQVYSQKLYGKKVEQLNLNNLPSGIYLLKVVNEYQTHFNKLIISY